MQLTTYDSNNSSMDEIYMKMEDKYRIFLNLHFHCSVYYAIRYICLIFEFNPVICNFVTLNSINQLQYK